jgi:hypothetical protein
MFANMNRDNKFSYAPADISAMGVDAVGTAGHAVEGAVPLIAGLAMGYVAADMVLKTKEKLEDQYKREKSGKPEKSYSQRLLEKEKTKVKHNRYSMHPAEDLNYFEWSSYDIPDR